MTVRLATADDRVAVARILDGALLETDDLGAAIGRDAVLVAERDGRVVGALVLDGSHVAAVAVARSRRREGVGTELVEAAADRHGELSAEFRIDVEPFWASLGFEIEERNGRLWGRRAGPGSE